MTTSVPVIKTAHLEGRNIHLISFFLFWQWGICQNKTQQRCVCTKQCKNVRVIIFLTLIVTHMTFYELFTEWEEKQWELRKLHCEST